jgi:hypothetical protein
MGLQASSPLRVVDPLAGGEDAGPSHKRCEPPRHSSACERRAVFGVRRQSSSYFREPHGRNGHELGGATELLCMTAVAGDVGRN